MKKAFIVSILAIMLILVTSTSVKATTNSDLADTLYNMGAKYGMTAGDKAKVERYLADYPVTESEANAIVAKAEEAIKIMEDAGVSSYNALSTEKKNQIKSIANEAAKIIDVTLVFGSKTVDVYKDGKLIDSVSNASTRGSSTSTTLAYTGNNNIVLIISGILVMALTSVIVVRKKLANA